ncbi:hypothetical protein [Aquibacillus sediminis]|uniref:hypothetical protein n=1 Tax=Aquibacillus sediminis TaxID=2574734 RepID=UPI001FE763E1|nr:hypothetical protein [Aquibacillus sediminis]
MCKKLLAELKETIDNKTASNLELDKLERITERLELLETDCTTCEQHLTALQTYIRTLINKQGQFEKQTIKQHKQKLQKITTHLQKQHQLVPDGYYLTMGLAFGTSLGVVFGAALNNIAIGISLGISIGVAIGISLDGDAKKKGNVI